MEKCQWSQIVSDRCDKDATTVVHVHFLNASKMLCEEHAQEYAKDMRERQERSL